MEDISNKAAPHEIYIQGIKAEERKKRRNRTLLILGLILIFGSGYTIFSWNSPGSISYKKLNYNELAGLTDKEVKDMLKNNNVHIIVYDFDRGRADTIATPEDYNIWIASRDLGPATPLPPVNPDNYLPQDEEPLQTFALEVVGDQKAGSVLSIMISDYDPNIEYELDYGNGMVKRAKEINMYMYKDAGEYDLKLTARDAGRESTSNMLITIDQGDPQLQTSTSSIAGANTPDANNEDNSDTDDDVFDQNNSLEDETESSATDLNSDSNSPIVVDNQQPISADNNSNTTPVNTDDQTGSKTDISLTNTSVDNTETEEIPMPGQSDLPILDEGMDSFDGDANNENAVAEDNSEEQVEENPTAEEADAPLSITGPLIAVETMPSFPGGENAMYAYLNDRIRYPQQARDYEVEGKVYVQFVVDQEGKVIEPKVVKGLGYGCDEEALRIVRLMPKWMPGKHRQQRVPVIYTLPVTFQFR